MKLIDMVNSDNAKASETASLVISLERDFDQGLLDKDEYLELLDDIQNTIAIEEGTLTIEMKANLLKGINALVKMI